MKKLVIAVSGINSVDNPGSGIGIIRSLKEANPKITCIGLSYDAMDPGLYMNQYVDKGYLLPYPSASVDKYLDRLLHICKQNKVSIIIPAFDSELPHYIKNIEVLRQQGIQLLIPNRQQFESSNKAGLHRLAQKLKILTPLTIPVSSFEELNAALERTGFPAVIKGCFYEAYYIHSYAEAHAKFNQIAAAWGLPVLIQQYVTGKDYNLIGCGGVGPKNKSVPLGAVPAKKLLLTKQNKIWTAVTIDNPGMVEIGRKFVEATGFTGGFELEFRISDRDELYLIEINPRFPAWVYLATAAGVNLPLRYVLNLTEKKYKFPNTYQVGKLLVRYTGEMIRDLSDFEKITINGERS